MKVLLVNFSGTGHTTICGDFLKKAFEELGHECEHYVLKAGQDISVDYIGLTGDRVVSSYIFIIDVPLDDIFDLFCNFLSLFGIYT